MLPLAAYADRLSVRPGETIRFHAHNATDAPVEGRLVRVLCAERAARAQADEAGQDRPRPMATP